MTKTPRLVLGTAQLGFAYGIANYTGMPEEADAVALIQAAVASGINTIDTARVYGEAEHRLGLALKGASNVKIVTKLDPLLDLSPNTPPAIAATRAEESLSRSRQALGRTRLDTVLLHRASHRTLWGGSVWRSLLEQQQNGTIGHLGISAQSSDEALQALDDLSVEHIQMPFNLLDRRWERAGIFNRLDARKDVVVHTRSAFLQGLLTGIETISWPNIPDVDPIALRTAIQRLVLDLGRNDPADLCLAFVRAHHRIDGVVVGIETDQQLRFNLAAFSRPPLDEAGVRLCLERLPEVPWNLLDPARWPK